MRKDIPEETATEARAEARAEPTEPTTDGSGETGPWGGFGRHAPSGGGAPIFSLSTPVGAGDRHDGLV